MVDFNDLDQILAILDLGGDHFKKSDLDHPSRSLTPANKKQLGLFVQELEDQIESEKSSLSPEAQERIDKKMQDFKSNLAILPTLNEPPPSPIGGEDATLDLREAHKLLEEVYNILKEEINGKKKNKLK